MFQHCQMSDLWAEPKQTQPRPLMRATKSWCKGQEESQGSPATNSVHLSFSPPDDWRMLTDTSGDVSGDQDCQTEGYHSRLHFSVCKWDTTGSFYVDLGTYNNQKLDIFRGKWGCLQLCLCWPKLDIFKVTWGHFHQCLWTPKPEILQGKGGPFPAMFVVTTT